MLNIPLSVIGLALVIFGAEIWLRQRALTPTTAWATPPLPRPDPQATRILVLGDSIAYGWELSPDQSWPALVEARLHRQYPHRRWQMINASICGDTAADAYTHFHVHVLAYRPQLVLIAVGLNDCRAVRDEGVQKRLAAFRRNETTGWGGSFVLRALANRIKPIAAPADLPPGDAQAPPRDFRHLLVWLARKSQRFGAAPCFVTLTPLDPDLHIEGAGEFGHWSEYSAIVRDTARAMNTPFIEVSHKLPGAHTWQSDGVHLTAEGAAAVAERIWQGLHRPHIAPSLRLDSQQSNAEMAPALE